MTGQPIIPCAVGTGSIRFQFNPPARPGGNNVGWIQINYEISGTLAPSITPAVFRSSIATKFETILNKQIYTNQGGLSAAWQINTPTNPQVAYAALPEITLNPTAPKDCSIGFNIQLRSNDKTRSGAARIHWPFVYPGDYSGSHITPAGKLRIANVLLMWRTTLSFGACRMVPVVWSRKHNTMSAVVSATISPLTMVCRKREPHWFNRHGTVAHCP